MFIRSLLLIIVLLVNGTCVYAGSVSSDVKTVIVSGMGIDADKARQNAVRNAVEQVVGSYVKSSTLLKNNQLINDEILSYSSGYVEESRVISTKNSDGLYNVQIEAKVASTRLVGKLESLNIATKKVKSAGLFSAALSKKDADRSKKEESATGGKMLETFLAKFPGAAYKVSVGELSVDSANSDGNTAKIVVPLSIKWDRAFIDEFMQTIKRTSKTFTEFEPIDKFLEVRKGIKYDTSKTVVDGFCFVSKTNDADKAGEYSHVGKMAPELCNWLVINKATDENAMNFDRYAHRLYSMIATLKVAMKNEQGAVVKVTRTKLDKNIVKAMMEMSEQKPQGGKIRKGKRTHTTSVMSVDKSDPYAVYSSLDFIPVSYRTGTLYNATTLILIDGELNIVVTEDLNIDLINTIKSMDVTIEAGN